MIKRKIILLSGTIGSGKGYITNKLIDEYQNQYGNILIVSFAQPIKEIIKNIYHVDKFGIKYKKEIMEVDTEKNFSMIVTSLCYYCNISRSDLHDKLQIENFPEFKNLHYKLIDAIKSEDIDYRRLYIRKMMQYIGTELAQSYDKFFWPRYLCHVLNNLYTDNIHTIIINDWRFLFEFIFLKDHLNDDFDIIPYFIHASDEIRAKRRGITLEELDEQSQHKSEMEMKLIIMNYMNLYYPDNIIINE